MATITCPDCSNQVSPSAQSCPHCGRPEPAKSIAAINEDNSNAVWGIIWFGHAAFVWFKLGFWWALASLFFGPLVWVAHWLFK